MQLERFLRDFQFNSCLEGILQSENYSRTDLPVGQTAEMLTHANMSSGIKSLHSFNKYFSRVWMFVQLDSLERNETELNTIMEKKLAHQLRDVTEATTRLYGNDLQIAERLLSRLLTFETQQSGFGLTATQDAYFNEVKITYF